MADTKISWTDKVWNITRGCRRISSGCGGANGEGGCYAERMAYRFSGPGQPYDGLVKMTANGPRWTGKGRFAVDKLSEPLSWRKPVRVFVDSMSDLFFDEFTNEQIAAVFGVMAACPQHTFQILTKRARRMREWFEWVDRMAVIDGNAGAWCIQGLDDEYPDMLSDRVFLGVPWPLPNVWIGVSVENQDAADERIPDLLRTPAAVRFLSCEPLLGPLDLSQWLENSISWIIAGCESGAGARPCDAAWLRSLRDQCAAACVPFFLKQAMHAIEPGIYPRVGENHLDVVACGPGSRRKPGGVIELPYLDGVQHAAFPEVAP